MKHFKTIFSVWLIVMCVAISATAQRLRAPHEMPPSTQEKASPDPLDVCHDSIDHMETLLHRFPKLATTEALIETLICPYGDWGNFEQGELDGLDYGNCLDSGRTYRVVALLLDNGANPDGRADDDMSPLECARDSAIAELLIGHGAKPDGLCERIWNWDGITPPPPPGVHHSDIHWGEVLQKGSGHTPLWTIFFEYPRPDVINRVDLALVHAFLNHGANANLTDGNKTLLYRVVEGARDFDDSSGYLDADLVRLLIQAGAKVNDNRNEDILMPAVQNRAVEVLQILLEAGADVNWRDNNGDPILHHALRLLDVDNARKKEVDQEELDDGDEIFDITRDEQMITLLRSHGAVEK